MVNENASESQPANDMEIIAILVGMPWLVNGYRHFGLPIGLLNGTSRHTQM